MSFFARALAQRDFREKLRSAVNGQFLYFVFLLRVNSFEKSFRSVKKNSGCDECIEAFRRRVWSLQTISEISSFLTSASFQKLGGTE